MIKEMNYLLMNLIEDLIRKSKNEKLKWKFNFSYSPYKDDSVLTESYSSEIKIKDKLTGIRISKTYYNEENCAYNILIDDLDFSGYTDSELESRLQILIKFIEKNNLISMYPSAVQKLIDFNKIEKIDQNLEVKSKNCNKTEDNKFKEESGLDKDVYFVYFSSNF